MIKEIHRATSKISSFSVNNCGRTKSRNTNTVLVETPLNGHPLNTDIPILQTILFVPTKISYIFSNIPSIADTQWTLFGVPNA